MGLAGWPGLVSGQPTIHAPLPGHMVHTSHMVNMLHMLHTATHCGQMVKLWYMAQGITHNCWLKHDQHDISVQDAQ